MTRDKAIAELIRIWHSPHLDLSLKAGLAEAIDALKGEDGDLIRRQDAREAIEKLMEIHFDRQVVLARARDAIVSLPSAEPKTGKWVEVEVFPEVYDIEGVKTWGSEMQCDQCGFRHTAIEGHMAQYNFCPNCGAMMMNWGEEE